MPSHRHGGEGFDAFEFSILKIDSVFLVGELCRNCDLEESKGETRTTRY
jgi:hypothetical protein